MWKTLLKFLLFFGVGFAILYFVYQNQAKAFAAECACTGNCLHATLWEKVLHDFSGAKIGWLVVVCLCFVVSVLSRAMRWTILIEPMGYKVRTFNTFFATMLGYLINLALPRAGEIAKPAALQQYEKVPLEKLMGTIVVDRIFDVIMLLLVFGLTFLTQFDAIYGFISGENRPAAPTCVNASATVEAAATGGFNWWWLIYGFLAVSAIGLVLVVWKWQQIKQSALYQRIYLLAVNFGEGIKTVFRLRRPYMFVFHTLLIWAMYFFMTYFCFWAYEPTAHLGADAALLAFVFGGLGILVPSPGGMGTYQIVVMAALLVYGIGSADAFAFANIIFFTINIFGNMFFGLLAYAVMPLYNRGYVPELPASHYAVHEPKK